ncbi:MAG: NnrS family protein [Rhodospirillales bacterium]|nr:NnrS family protein [Rhodospirillales bacterium]
MTAVGISEPPGSAPPPRFALFAYGFRPFFLAAAIHAAVSILVWLAMLRGWLPPPSGVVATLWHAHEMVFGPLAAAMAGFLLTTVPNWTGEARLHGPRLMALFAVWLAGRAAFAWIGALPPALTAAVDLAFFPALCLAIAPALLRRSRRRNGAFVLMPVAMFAANACWHADAMGLIDAAATASRLAIDVVLIVVTVIAGRIVPAFTQSGLRMAGRAITIRPSTALDRLAVAATALILVVDAMPLDGRAAVAILAAACAVHAIRLARWQGHATLGVPLVWSLHLGYAWLVAGLALRAAAAHGAVPDLMGVHALTAGAMGTLILAVMTRASLGHTGRPLRAGAAETAAYLLVAIGAALRVASGWPSPAAPALLTAGGVLWALAFAVFAARYAPILIGPRVDGRPG